MTSFIRTSNSCCIKNNNCTVVKTKVKKIMIVTHKEMNKYAGKNKSDNGNMWMQATTMNNKIKTK